MSTPIAALAITIRARSSASGGRSVTFVLALASSRMIREETMSAPIAALAIVLAITIRARSSASGGRSVTFVLARNRASSPAMLILRPPIAE